MNEQVVEKNIPQKKPLPQQKVETPGEISSGTWMLMIGTALFFDACEALISLVPILGEIVSVLIDMLAFGTFWLWFKMHGASYSKKTFLGGFIVGFIPIINMLPECTLTIVMLYFDAKAKKAIAIVPGGQLAVQAHIQGHMAKNTVMVNGERKNTSDAHNPNSKPAFRRFQDVPTPINSQRLSPAERVRLEAEGKKIMAPIISSAEKEFSNQKPLAIEKQNETQKNNGSNKKVLMMPKRDV
jgi:hypothetical protein